MVFDTNRTWTAKLALLSELYPQARVIAACARSPGSSTASNVWYAETRCSLRTGLIGLAWSSLREAWFSEDASRLILVRYDSLARNPKTVLDRLHHELGEPPFTYAFDVISFDAPTYDAQLGMPGLHQVRPRVDYMERETCLPADLFAKYADVNFWLNQSLNRRGVVVL